MTPCAVHPNQTGDEWTVRDKQGTVITRFAAPGGAWAFARRLHESAGLNFDPALGCMLCSGEATEDGLCWACAEGARQFKMTPKIVVARITELRETRVAKSKYDVQLARALADVIRKHEVTTWKEIAEAHGNGLKPHGLQQAISASKRGKGNTDPRFARIVYEAIAEIKSLPKVKITRKPNPKPEPTPEPEVKQPVWEEPEPEPEPETSEAEERLERMMLVMRVLTRIETEEAVTFGQVTAIVLEEV